MVCGTSSDEATGQPLGGWASPLMGRRLGSRRRSFPVSRPYRRRRPKPVRSRFNTRMPEPAQPPADLLPVQREATLAYRVIRLWAAPLLRALFRITVEGRERMPTSGAYVLIANHLNWLDSFAILATLDRKSTRLNSSHLGISYAVFCLKKKNVNASNQTPPAATR